MEKKNVLSLSLIGMKFFSICKEKGDHLLILRGKKTFHSESTRFFSLRKREEIFSFLSLEISWMKFSSHWGKWKDFSAFIKEKMCFSFSKFLSFVKKRLRIRFILLSKAKLNFFSSTSFFNETKKFSCLKEWNQQKGGTILFSFLEKRNEFPLHFDT